MQVKRDYKLYYLSFSFVFLLYIQGVVIGANISEMLFPIFSVVLSVAISILIDEGKDIQHQYIFLTLIRLFIVVLFSTFVYRFNLNNKILSLYPDQYFYLETAEEICRAISVNGFSVNFKEIVGLHNMLYNIIGGVVLYFNGGDIQNIYRYFNFLVHSLIIFETFQLYKMIEQEGNNKKKNIILIIISLMPSMLIFTVLSLRDILISYFVISSYRNMKEKRIFNLALVLFLSYYLRKQLPLLLIVTYFINKIIYIVLFQSANVFKTVFKFFLVLTGLLLGFVFLFPHYRYIVESLTPLNILKFGKQFLFNFTSLNFMLPSMISIKILKITLIKLMTPEVFLLPILFIYFMTKNKLDIYNSSVSYLVIFLFLYSFGYFVQYGVILTRHYFPLYPLLLIYVVHRIDFQSLKTGLK